MNHSLAPSIVSTNAICSIMNTYSFSNENPWTVSNRIVRKLILSEIHGPRQHGQNNLWYMLMKKTWSLKVFVQVWKNRAKLESSGRSKESKCESGRPDMRKVDSPRISKSETTRSENNNMDWPSASLNHTF